MGAWSWVTIPQTLPKNKYEKNMQYTYHSQEASLESSIDLDKYITSVCKITDCHTVTR